MRYILYARKSSESEDRQVQSIDDQLDVLRRLSQQRGFLVVEEMVESRSAKAPGTRQVFARMIETIEKGGADAILCWSINRLARNPVDGGTLSWMLQQGTLQSIVTVDREYRPEDNVLLMAVESGVANQYVLDLRKAVTRGMQSKRDKGWYPHRAPAGYLNDPLTREIHPDPDRFALLRQAWEMLLTGAYTATQVMDELNRAGYRTRGGKKYGRRPMQRSAMYALFANPFYTGWFRCGPKLYKGLHKPMVTRDEFDRVQRILGRDHHSQPQKREFAFTGFIRCGLCGCLVTAEDRVKHYPRTGQERTYRYYHCSGSKGCTKQSVSEEYIEREIRRMLEECTLTVPEENWIEKVLARHDAERPARNVAIGGHQGRAVTHARTMLDGLFEMRATGEITKDEFLDKKRRLEAEIEDLSQAQERQDTKRARDRETLRNVLEYSSTAYDRFTRGDIRRKREVAALLGESYLLTLGKLEIQPHPLLDLIRTFEPVEVSSSKSKEALLASACPLWWSIVNNIRTSIKTRELTFPPLVSYSEIVPVSCPTANSNLSS